MKKALTQTIIVFVALNLITAGFALAQEEVQEALAAQKQAEAAQKQLEATQKELEALQKKMETDKRKMQVELRQKEVPQIRTKIGEIQATLGEMMAAAPRVGIPVWQHSGSGTVLVIPAAQMKVEDLAAITEDMTVMSRIFAKKLSQARLTTGRGSWYVEDYNPFFGRDSGTIEAVYLEGYAALFLMKVNVLLSPPPETQQEKETEEEDTDPLWTQMRQEMYAPLLNVNRRRRTDRPEEKYDAEKVAEFRETLIKTLKHAANIRSLKPDESVILTVIGKASQPAGVTIQAIGRTGQILVHDKDKRNIRLVKAPSLSDIGFSSPTVLTIRAKKSDIDAFAKGQLNFDQFHQRVQLLLYSYLTENVDVGPSRSSRTRMSDYMSELMREE